MNATGYSLLNIILGCVVFFQPQSSSYVTANHFSLHCLHQLTPMIVLCAPNGPQYIFNVSFINLGLAFSGFVLVTFINAALLIRQQPFQIDQI